MKTKAVYLSFDLGIKGDYTSLFSWLDNHNALECGNGLAYFKYETNAKAYEEFFQELENDIKQSVNLSKNDRLYAIVKDENTNLVKGKFISGTRRQSPWEGYGKIQNSQLTDSE